MPCRYTLLFTLSKERQGLINAVSLRGLFFRPTAEKGSVAKIDYRPRRLLASPTLCGNLEEALNKLRLSYSITSIKSLHLPFAHHVNGFDPLQCSLSSIKGAIAETCSHPIL